MPDQNLLEQATQLFTQRVQQYAQGMAEHLGGPLSGVQLTQDEAVQRWNYTPLGNTDQADQQYYNLLQQGMQPGQALDQVYPMRKPLLQGPDLPSIISKAQQIAGWAADATGQSQPPQYQGNTLPLLQMQQRPPPPPPMPMPLQAQPGPMPPPPAPPGMAPAVSPLPAPPLPAAPPAPAPVMPLPAAMPPPPPINPATLPPPATTAPPNAEAPLGGGLIPPGQGPTGTIQA